VAARIIECLDVPWVTLLSMDSFYKVCFVAWVFGRHEFIKSIFSQVLNQKQHELAENNEYNFDHPDAFDFELLAQVLQKLKECKKVEVPVYNFVTHSRETRTVIPELLKLKCLLTRQFISIENHVWSQRHHF
jgi:uridine kinase